MDSGSEVPRKSKRRFQPKAPTPSLRPIPPNSNTEAEIEEENKKAARQLAKRIGIGQRRPKTETKTSPVEVAFQSNLSSLSIRSFGLPEEDNKHGSATTLLSVSSAGVFPAVSSVTARKDEEEVPNLVTRTEEDYVEPWDYRNSYYPTVLPLRKPNSGDPELLDQEEFGGVAKHLEYDENMINSAEELSLSLGQHCKKQMLFFQLPNCLPITKQSTGENSKRSVPENRLNRSNPFEGLPKGLMGKMQVYKSGAVKFKVGDVLYDVSPGPNTICDNDVAMIDTEGRNYFRIGSYAKFATVTPDVESLLKSASDMQTHK